MVMALLHQGGDRRAVGDDEVFRSLERPSSVKAMTASTPRTPPVMAARDRSASQVSSSHARSNWRKVFAARKFLSLAKIQSRQAPADLVVGGQYRVGKKIANGAFGQLRIGTDVANEGHSVAIKLESTGAKIPMLFLEFRFYRILGPHPCLPKVFHYGPCGKYNALVMELLGPNLEELFVACRRQFSLKTILLLAIQLLSRIEFVHSHGIVYRDIKPENCLVGRPSQARTNQIYMVDFGLAKEFVDPETGRHIPYAENKSLTGTVRYMSVNSHQGREQSRRDDLEALGHVFFYFLSGGHLPWQGVKCDDLRKRYQIIGQIKEETRISDLGNKYPWEFSLYLRYCRSLKFAQEPDYTYLKNLFRGCLARIIGESADEDGNSVVFDWMSGGGRSKRDLTATEISDLRKELSPNHRYSGIAAPLPPALDENYAMVQMRSRSNESVVLSRQVTALSRLAEESSFLQQQEAKEPQQIVDETEAATVPEKPIAAIEPFVRFHEDAEAIGRRHKIYSKLLNKEDKGEGKHLGKQHVEFVSFDSCCSFLKLTKKFGILSSAVNGIKKVL